MIVMRGDLDALEIVGEPAQHGRIAITYPHYTRHHVLVEQMTPARHRAAKLPAHQAATDDTKIDYTLLHMLRPYYRQRLLRRGGMVYQRHQRAHHLRGASVLDDVPTV